VEHRTTSADVTPSWYKRPAYLMIIAVIVVIVVYAVYILVIAPPAAPAPVVPDNGGIPNYSAGQNP